MSSGRCGRLHARRQTNELDGQKSVALNGRPDFTFNEAISQRAKAIGHYGATAGVAVVVGQLAGGALLAADIGGTD